MPVRAEAFFSQPPDSAFGEIFVLKTSAGQNHFLFTHAPRDGDDAFNHRVVKLRRDFSGRDASTDIVDDAESHWQPVNDDGGLLIAFTQIRGVGFIRIGAIEREFQFHCALRFELRDLANTGDGRHGVEDSSGARRDRRVDLLQQHLAQQFEFMRRK